MVNSSQSVGFLAYNTQKRNMGLKRAIHSQLNWAILLCDCIRDGKTEQTAQF